jgi:hypothetical protein
MPCRVFVRAACPVWRLVKETEADFRLKDKLEKLIVAGL